MSEATKLFGLNQLPFPASDVYVAFFTVLAFLPAVVIVHRALGWALGWNRKAKRN